MSASIISNQDFALQRYVNGLIDNLKEVTELNEQQERAIRTQMTVTYGHFINEIQRLKAEKE